MNRSSSGVGSEMSLGFAYNRLPRGTLLGAQGFNPDPVRKCGTDWTEPSYVNNKVGGVIFGLNRICTRACQVCPMLDIESSVIRSTVNQRKYPILTNQNLSCRSKNLIYVLTCNVCAAQYVGETEQTLSARINGHKTGIRQGFSEEYQHFRCDDAHNDVPIIERFKIQIAEKVFEEDVDVNDSNYKSKMKSRRAERELAWTCRLQTIYPLGLNTKIRGVGMTNDPGRCKPFNFFTLSSAYDSRLQKKKHSSKIGRRRRQSTLDELRVFINSLNEMSVSACLFQIRQRNLRFLRRCVHVDRFRELSDAKQKLILDWTEYGKDKKTTVKKKSHNRLYMEINFIHKDIQKVNLRRILNEQSVRQSIPATCRFKELPVIYYKYSKNISHSILNYNSATRETSFESFQDIQDLPCSCNEEDVQTFVDPFHGHVLTGDLRIIQNEELRHIMSKGAKFRETPTLSRSQIEDSLFRDLENFKEKWCDRENMEFELDRWISIVKQRIAGRLNIMFNVFRGHPVLAKREVREELARLKSRYVITVVDKAANNFAFQCRKFYFLRGARELGLDNLQGNATYSIVDDKASVSERIQNEMIQKFNIPIQIDEYPTIFWTPKFHKNPVKFRPIAGSRNKILSPLESVVGKILKKITSHFKNYCGVAERMTNFRHYFSIKNSAEMLLTLDRLKGKAETFDSFDFSNLYTNFRHDEIIEKLHWLIDMMFSNSGKAYISVPRNYSRADYSDTPLDVGRGWSYNCDKVKEAISFLIGNTYIEFGCFFLKQVCGIPMGSIPAPDIANLCLSVDEFRFVKSCLALRNFPLLKKMNFVARYLDDVGTCNFSDYDAYTITIYSGSLTLNRSNEDSSTNSVAYLDLSVSVVNHHFIAKVYCKTDDYNFEVISLPFLESNVAEEMCYYVYFGQILRFMRICSLLTDFRDRSSFLTHMLVLRGYAFDRLAKKFMEVMYRYRAEVVKYGHFGLVRTLMLEVIYGYVITM